MIYFSLSSLWPSVAKFCFGCSLILGQGVCYALSADPNLAASDPNRSAFGSTFSHPDPNTSGTLPGTLAMNWLYQSKKPPEPLVGQENITFRTEVYPWPYIGFERDNYFADPWFYHPWYRYDYWRYYRNTPWRPYGDYHGRWWYRDDYTYPLNHVEVQMKLDADTSLHFGADFLSDPLNN
jgi:hypothetical protein